MNSPFTGKPMKFIIKNEEHTYRSEKFVIKVHYYLCEDTQEEITTTALDRINVSQWRNQYREKHNIPFKEEIIALRQRYDLTYGEISDLLGFGPNTYKNYEKGEVPNKSNGQLLRLAMDQRNLLTMLKHSETIKSSKKQQLIQRIEAENSPPPVVAVEGLYKVNPPLIKAKPSLRMGYQPFWLEKAGAIVAHLAQHCQPFTTQLNKLLFYADFGHYKRRGYSITGMPYRAIKMGPVPSFYKELYNYLEHAQWVTVERQYYPNGAVGTQYHADNTEARMEQYLSEIERATIELVQDELGHLSTDEIINKSHEEQAWLAHVEDRSIITYDHAYYLKHL